MFEKNNVCRKGRLFFGYENKGVNIKLSLDLDEIDNAIKDIKMSREEKRLQQRREIEQSIPLEIV